MTDRPSLIANTTAIVSAYIARHQLITADIPGLIRSVHTAMSEVGHAPAPLPVLAMLKPAVPVNRSVSDDYIICLEDGARLKLLKPYLRSRFGLTPAAYKAKWMLPDSYPMVAPRYARIRSDIAKAIGLGSRPDTPRGGRKRIG